MGSFNRERNTYINFLWTFLIPVFVFFLRLSSQLKSPTPSTWERLILQALNNCRGEDLTWFLESLPLLIQCLLPLARFFCSYLFRSPPGCFARYQPARSLHIVLLQFQTHYECRNSMHPNGQFRLHWLYITVGYVELNWLISCVCVCETNTRHALRRQTSC